MRLDDIHFENIMKTTQTSKLQRSYNIWNRNNDEQPVSSEIQLIINIHQETLTGTS